MTSKWDYHYLARFNTETYKDLLFAKHLGGGELFVGKCKDDKGIELDVDKFFYPLNKDRVSFLLPSEYLNQLPVKVNSYVKMSVQNKAYRMITDCTPAGFTGVKTFRSVKEFVHSFCDYEHEMPVEFLLWKLVAITSYLRRVNVRVSSQPSFGKDSVMKVMNDLLGNIGIVHNPTPAKVEYLLQNKILMTNEVAGVKAEDSSHLENYYLTCGDFSNSYEKRSIANYRGAKDTYDISRLSNVVCYNDIDCYPQSKLDKYFDNLFQKAVLQRFIPFRFRGRISDSFSGSGRDVRAGMLEHKDLYRDTIKMFRYLQEHLDEELHGYEYHDFGFKDRWSRNWSAIAQFVDAYAGSKEEYEVLLDKLYAAHVNYLEMVQLLRGDLVVSRDSDSPWKQWEEEVK